MKKALALLLSIIMLLAFTGCDRTWSDILGIDAPPVGNVPIDDGIYAEDGYAEGELGDTLVNAFFAYSVDSAEIVDSYAGYTAGKGMQLLDCVITVTNVFGDEIPMFNSDFQIQWGDGDEDYGYGLILDDSTSMPDEYTLAADETVTYHVVYEVPAGTDFFSVSYMEIYADNTEGDVFFVYFEA